VIPLIASTLVERKWVVVLDADEGEAKSTLPFGQDDGI